jgi:predicted RNA-binding Zn-ribbon protein involved in translation (DUF1610 family)
VTGPECPACGVIINKVKMIEERKKQEEATKAFEKDMRQAEAEKRKEDKEAAKLLKAEKAEQKREEQETARLLKAQADQTNRLTQCSDCNKTISIRATTCPHCGAPVTIHGETMVLDASLTTIQQTSKRLKGQIILSAICFFMGLFWFSIGFGAPPPFNFMGLLLMLGGIIWYLVTKAKIWWHHK